MIQLFWKLHLPCVPIFTVTRFCFLSLEPPLFTMTSQLPHEPVGSTSNDGWDDFDSSNWGTFEDTPSKPSRSPASSGGLSKQEQLQKRREERRLKQQAAREKRAAGVGLKPGGLGSVKKN